MSVNPTLHHNPSHEYRPHVPDPHCSGIPGELKQQDQWLGFRAIRKPNGKINKPPIDANTGGPGSSTNSSTWGSFDAASRRSPAGAAFVLTPDDQYFALDIDGCVNADTGEISPDAQKIVDRFPIYWEISYSSTGLRGIGRGVLPKTGCKKGNIEVYDQGRYVVMTGHTLPGHETIRNCQRELVAWHAEVWPIETQQPTRAQPTWSGAGMTNEQILEKAFRARNGEKIRRLYRGDTSDYPPSQSDPGFSSEADQALVNLLCPYTPNDDQLTDLWRSSGLYRKKLDRNDYVERTIAQARKDQSWSWSPESSARPQLTPVPNADADIAICADIRAQLQAAYALIAQKDETIIILQERIRRLDERDAIQRNTKLGAARTTGAVLANLFQEEKPRKPDAQEAWRVPLAKLADRTGLSTDTCSKQIKQLAKFKTLDGTPVLHAETIDVPRTVIQDTGEIIEAHKEVWVGPGVDPAKFGRILATLAPSNAPKHGGAADRNVCPDHPEAGVTRRSRNLRRITYECACCQKVLDTQVIPVGRETTQHLPSVVATDPMPHDAGSVDNAPESTDESAPHPIPQHAASIDNHSSIEQSGKMRHSPPSGLAEPAWLWDRPAGEAGNDWFTA